MSRKPRIIRAALLALSAAAALGAAPAVSPIVAAWGGGVPSGGLWPDISGPAPFTGGGERDAAVIVAIEEYKNLPRLAGAKANAWGWFDFFNKTRGVPGANVTMLLDAEGSAEGVKEAVAKAAGQAGPDGTLWFVFIGYGESDEVARDTTLSVNDSQRPARGVRVKSVSQKALLASLAAAKAGAVAVVIDACPSAPAPSGEDAAENKTANSKTPAAVPDARVALFSSRRGADCLGRLPGAERPALSYLVLGGLRGWADADGDGRITAAELEKLIASAFPENGSGRGLFPAPMAGGRSVPGVSAGEKSPDMSQMGKTGGQPVSSGLVFNPPALPAAPRAVPPAAMNASAGAEAQPPEPVKNAAAGDPRFDAAARYEKGRAAPELKSARWLELGKTAPEYAELAEKQAKEWDAYAAKTAWTAAVERDSGGEAPEAKVGVWRGLGAKYSRYQGDAAARAAEWARYASELAEAGRAREARGRVRDADWNRLSRMLVYAAGDGEKKRLAAAFIAAYGTDADEDPYVVYLLPFMDMALIPSGGFLMGSPAGEGEPDERPQHDVYLSAFCMDRYEVTAAEYGAFSTMTRRTMPEQPLWSTGRHPVVNVDWSDAAAYCAWAGKRLPTEAEWEKAARCGSVGRYSFGDDEKKLGDYAWYHLNAGGQAHPVGLKTPNAYGIYDMAGNVWEWTADRYGIGYYSVSPPENPKGPDSGPQRVLRGGSWNFFDVSQRASDRGSDLPSVKSPRGGFRCVF